MSNGAILPVALAFFRPNRGKSSEEDVPAQPPSPILRDQSWTPPPPPPRTPLRRILPGSIFALLGLILLLAALFLPWYSYTMEARINLGTIDYDMKSQVDLTFKDISMYNRTTAAGFSLTSSFSTSWDDYSRHFQRDQDRPSQLPGVYSNTMLLLVPALILCALALVLILLFRHLRRSFAIPVLLLLLGAVFGLAAAGAFSAWHPPAAKNDLRELPWNLYAAKPADGPYNSFFGVTSQGGFDYRWGPASGWNLAIAGSAMVLVGMILLLVLSRRKTE